MQRLGLGLLVLVLGLACGGTPDAEQALGPLCDVEPVVYTTLELAKLPIAAVPFDAATALEIGPKGMFIRYAAVDDDRLEAILKSEREGLGILGGGQDLLVLVSEDTMATRVVTATQKAQSAGFTRVRFVVSSQDANPMPVYVDPLYAADLEKEISSADGPGEGQRMMAAKIAGLLRACPGAQEVFNAVASASADQRCEMVAVGLNEALPSCVLTDSEKVITAFQVISKPQPFAQTTIDFVLDADSPVFSAPADATWATFAPSLLPK